MPDNILPPAAQPGPNLQEMIVDTVLGMDLDEAVCALEETNKRVATDAKEVLAECERQKAGFVALFAREGAARAVKGYAEAAKSAAGLALQLHGEPALTEAETAHVRTIGEWSAANEKARLQRKKQNVFQHGRLVARCMLRIDFVFALRRVSVFPLLVVSLFCSSLRNNLYKRTLAD